MAVSDTWESGTYSFVADSTAAQTNARLPPLERIDGEPQFRFFVAGARASGKTVFLASLYNQLAVTGNSSHFYARLASDANDISLREKFNLIRDATQSWPPGDADATEYVFICFYLSPELQEAFPLFRFHYTDFPGGNLTHPSADQALNVRAAVKNAHTVVFLIDGRKILDALNHATIEGFSINDDLDIISQLATDCIFRPMQFIITKWDILSGHSLEEVRRFLFSHTNFSKVVQTRKAARKPTYLIPVSAVGDKFADYDPVSHAMVKRPGEVPQPYNLDISLALAITDTLLNSFRASLSSRDLFRLRLLKTLVGSGLAIKWIAKTGTIIINDPWVMSMMVILNKTSDHIASLSSRIEEEQGARLSGITNKNTALDNITQVQHLRVTDFLSRFPAADLLRDQ